MKTCSDCRFFDGGCKAHGIPVKPEAETCETFRQKPWADDYADIADRHRDIVAEIRGRADGSAVITLRDGMTFEASTPYFAEHSLWAMKARAKR